MKNYIQPGAQIAVTATAAIASGDFVRIGVLSGVAQGAAAIGDEVVLIRRGVFTLPKTSAEAWTVGAAVYWDATNKVCTITANGNTLIGAAVAVAANPSASGDVLLDGTLR